MLAWLCDPHRKLVETYAGVTAVRGLTFAEIMALAPKEEVELTPRALL